MNDMDEREELARFIFESFAEIAPEGPGLVRAKDIVRFDDLPAENRAIIMEVANRVLGYLRKMMCIENDVQTEQHGDLECL